MGVLIKTNAVLTAIVTFFGRIGMWAVVALAVVTVFDVISRRFFVLGSTRIQEAEWHLHVILFGLCLGWAYLNDKHVRVDIVRETLKPRLQMWIELLGVLFFLLPYCALVVWYGIDFTATSFAIGESSNSAAGLPYRWAIKAFLPLSMAILAVSGVTVAIRQIVLLFGNESQVQALKVAGGEESAPLPSSERPM